MQDCNLLRPLKVADLMHQNHKYLQVVKQTVASKAKHEWEGLTSLPTRASLCLPYEKASRGYPCAWELVHPALEIEKMWSAHQAQCIFGIPRTYSWSFFNFFRGVCWKAGECSFRISYCRYFFAAAFETFFLDEKVMPENKSWKKNKTLSHWPGYITCTSCFEIGATSSCVKQGKPF